MIIRKYPSADLSRFRGLFYAIGFTVSLVLVNMAFEWKFYDDGSLANLNTDVDAMFDELIDIPPTEQPPPPPPAKTARIEIIEVPDVEEIEEEINIDLDIEVTEEMVFENVVVDEIAIVEEVAEEIFTIVEVAPTPAGGYGEFYKFVNNEIKYPAIARRMNVEGKVFVQFVIEKDGSLTDFYIARGIGAGCDDEAIRVLKLAKKWQPGRQRGKEVRVRMVLPITFQILE